MGFSNFNCEYKNLMIKIRFYKFYKKLIKKIWLGLRINKNHVWMKCVWVRSSWFFFRTDRTVAFIWGSCVRPSLLISRILACLSNRDCFEFVALGFPVLLEINQRSLSLEPVGHAVIFCWITLDKSICWPSGCGWFNKHFFLDRQIHLLWKIDLELLGIPFHSHRSGLDWDWCSCSCLNLSISLDNDVLLL